jgi:hypothetical protein
MDNKAIVKAFFSSDYYKNKATFESYVHPDVEINWNSSKGFIQFDYDSFHEMVQKMGKSFRQMTPEISHCFQEDDKVCIRFSYLVDSVETEDYFSLADFICIWELKDNLLYKGYFMSQAADEESENFSTFINL